MNLPPARQPGRLPYKSTRLIEPPFVEQASRHPVENSDLNSLVLPLTFFDICSNLFSHKYLVHTLRILQNAPHCPLTEAFSDPILEVSLGTAGV